MNTYKIPLLVLLGFTLLFSVSCEKIEPVSYDLYLLIGQSNMAGRGLVSGVDTVTHERVWTLDKQNTWVLGKEPIHFDKPERLGTGPGLAFGKAMAANFPDAKIGLIPCAVGGTRIDLWQEGGYYNKTGAYPYDEAIARTKLALECGVLKGIIWHQGESDSNVESVPLYEDRLVALIQKLRIEFNAPDVPFVVGGLGNFYIARNPFAGEITEVLSRAPEFIDVCAFVPVGGLTDKGDSLHFSTRAARTLGERYAQKMVELQRKN